MITLTKKFCVYVDFIEKDDEFIPGYVGKGNQGRVNCKIRNKQHQKYSKKHDWKRVVGYETDDESEAYAIEALLVKELHTFVYDPEKSEYACNQSIGGEGPNAGSRASKETREKCRIAQIRRFQNPIERQRQIERCREMLSRKDVKEKIRLAHSGANAYQAKSVDQYSMDGIFIARYGTISDACNVANSGHVKDVCEGHRPHAGGFRWCYAGERLKDFMKIRPSFYQAVEQYTIDGIFIARYETVRKAKDATNIGHIDQVGRGERKTAGGFIWKYVEFNCENTTTLSS